ncbi:hypothetical protein [Spirosoma knui]
MTKTINLPKINSEYPNNNPTDTQTRDYLVAQGLRTPLQIANEWRWKE